VRYIQFPWRAEQAEKALEKAGYKNYWQDFANFFHFRDVDYKSRGNKKAEGSGHFAVDAFEYEHVITESGVT